MPKYFFHLRDGVDHVIDPEGLEMPEQAIVGAALMQARDCIAGDVHRGRLDLHCHIDVHAQDGELVHSLAFSDALEIVPAK